MKVLLVEDAAIIRKRVHAQLDKMQNVKVVACTEDVEPGKLALIATHPDLVIVDIKLKSSNGCDLIKYTARRHPHTKIFVYSNLEDEAVREIYVAHGAHRVFDKAFEFFEMIDAVRELAEGTP
jgi:DNA-binding NarL/FixJ family response regulator